MRLKEVARTLATGCALYVAMAISAADSERHPHDAGSPGARAIAELVASPVPYAHAELSGTRLKSKYGAGADGSKLFESDVMYDSQLGVDCQFTSTGFVYPGDPTLVTASDDKVRCLPAPGPDSDSITGGPKYSDTDCTQPVVELAELPGVPTGCTAVYPKWVWYIEATGYCSLHYRVHMFEVEPGTLSNANVYRKNGSSCDLVGGVPSLKLKPEAPVTTFVEATLGNDP